MVAGALNLIGDDCVYGRHWGCLRKYDSLHFELCYYQASTQVDLPNIDQRLTEDVENFAVAISELYNHTLKPFLDVVLFTRSLSRVMGYKTQATLYGYFFFVALTLKAISPPLSLMHAQESGLSGNLRGAHHRLVSKTEEIAYNDPPAAMTEQLLLNKHLIAHPSS